MIIRSQLGAGLALLVMTASVAWAQTAPAPSQEPTQLNLLIEPQLVRFTTSAASLDWRLEIADVQGQPVFDTGLVSGSVLDWPLVTEGGQHVDSGTYAYVITINPGQGQPMRTYRGRLAIERMNAIYRVIPTEGEPSADVALTMISPETPDARTAGTGEAAPRLAAQRFRIHWVDRRLGRKSLSAEQAQRDA
jgi:hypothetical protein